MADITTTQRAWSIFKRNKLALAGLAFIAFTIVLAVLGYLIMPDSTPNANNMAIQLSTKKPGTKYTVLCIRNADHIDTVNIIQKMLFGQPSFYREVPITGYHFKKDSIYIDEYIGDEDKPELKAYNIFEVVTGIKPVYRGNKVYLKNKLLNTPVEYAYLQNQIKANQIKRKVSCWDQIYTVAIC